MENLKYPIGKYIKPEIISDEIVQQNISTISSFPHRLKEEVFHLTNEQLDTAYRPEGWTIRQVVNHCADSHMNSLIRYKLALTEETPTIRPYFEDRWAELPDSKSEPIAASLLILEGVHARWTTILNSLSKSDFEKSFIHPEHNRAIKLDEATGLYAWHCNHHLKHITNFKETKNWK